MLAFYISLGATAIVLAVLALSSGRTRRGMMGLSTWCLFSLALVGYLTYNTLLGSPIKAYPPDHFVYLSHDLSNEGTIIITTYIPEVGYRLYEVPYDRDTETKLEGADQQREGGVIVEGGFKEDSGNNAPSLEFYDNPRYTDTFTKGE